MGRSILRNEKLISCHFSVHFSRYLLDILVVLTVLDIEGRVLICEEEMASTAKYLLDLDGQKFSFF